MKPTLKLPDDNKLLAFIFARFIDGELTGLKEGNTLNYAPTLDAADFLAKQIRDEIRHARMYRTLYQSVSDTSTLSSPWLLKLIMNPIHGRLWTEHCFLDKAVGERWVLYLMETIAAHIEDRKIKNYLNTIAKDERTHIAFGEEQTRLKAAQSAFWRFYLWGLFLRVDYAMGLAYKLTRTLILKHYSAAAAEILTTFFTDARQKIRQESAVLLAVRGNVSLWRMCFAQIIFWLRWPFCGWLQNPKKNF
ncbi:MAG TPA: hypothetical protein PLY93_02840 [Turneriella sp.]|nr:hypothetical protein [Turneriella sp.]